MMNDKMKLKVQIMALRDQIDLLSKEARKIINDIEVLPAPMNYNPKPARFVEKIHRLIALGHDEPEAIRIAGENFEYSRETACYFWARAKNHKKGLRSYAFTFLAKKLKDKGYSIRVIAQMLDTSPANISRLIKKELV